MADGVLFPAGLWPALAVGELVVLAGAVWALVVVRWRRIRDAAESQEHLGIAAQAMGIGLWSLDLRTNRLTWDDRMFALYGRDRGDFRGAYDVWRESLHPDDLSKAETAFRNAVEGPTAFDTQFRIVRPDGTIRHIRAFAQVLLDPKGQPTRMVGTNTDVTDQAELADRLTKLARTLPGAVFQMRRTAEGRWTIPFLDGGLTAAFGLPQGRLCTDAAALFDRVHPDDRDHLRRSAEASARDLTVWAREMRVMSAGGTPLWLAVQAMPERLFDGSVLWHGVLTDISARRAIEAALARSERRFRDIAETLSDWIWEVDADGRYTYVAGNVMESLGYRPDEMLGRAPFDFLNVSPDPDTARAAFRHAVSSAVPIKDHETWNRARDGRLVCMLTNGIPILDDHGAVIGYRGTDKDITDRKAAEDKARMTHERYVESQLIGRVGHWRRDLRSSEVTWSEGVFAIFGLDPTTFDTEYDGIIDLIDPRDQHIVVDALHRIAATGHPETYHFRFRRADGERIIWNQGHRETDADGTPIAVFGVVRDVTEEQTRLDALTEERRKALELMELAQTASLAKSSFLATMSHELRTPLNAIIGFSEMMTLQTLGPMTPVYVEYTHNVLDSARLLLSLIDDILDLARVESGRREITVEALDVTEEIEACVRTVALKAKERDLTVRTEVAPDTGTLVADQRAVRQVLLNLVSNALKFTPPGGHVTVRADSSTDGAVRLTVEDTGIGIPPEDHDRVFEAFSRARDADQRAIQGTGLGLTLVKALMDLHDGHVTLRSAPGHGTAVTVVFPPREANLMAHQGKPALV